MSSPEAQPVVVPPELMPRPEDFPDLNQFVIEDGKPVDGILSEKQMRLMTRPLHASWAGPPDGRPFVVMADVGVFIAVGVPALVPDFLLSADVTQGTDLSDKANLSYFVWLRGKAPDVVGEIVSNREGGEDTKKLRAYARIGVPYYVIFDPEDYLDGGVLRVFELRGRRYVAMREPYYFEDLGVGVRLWTGQFEGVERTWLRWCDRDGNVIPTGEERAVIERQRAEREKERAEREKERAEREKERARTAVSELEDLKRKLREMGIEPPA